MNTQKLALPGLDFGALDLSEVASDILDISFTFLVTPNLEPESAGLFKVDW